VEAGAFLRIGLASIHYIELDGGIENPPFSEVGTRRGRVPPASWRNEPDQTTELSMKTFTAKSETVQRDWYLVDAAGKTLGRLSTELARRLRGKHKPVYTPHVDTGDYLIVINAEKIAVTGNKLQDKKYHRFTGYIGNLKTETLAQALERHPERVIETAVKGMLPKGPLGRDMYRKLKVYKGSEHPHSAQQPQPLDI
jgi:large subunit ribosomal protein L13